MDNNTPCEICCGNAHTSLIELKVTEYRPEWTVINVCQFCLIWMREESPVLDGKRWLGKTLDDLSMLYENHKKILKEKGLSAIDYASFIYYG